MPVFIAALLGGLINICGTIAGRVLIGLGISVITYTGLSASIDFLKDSAVAQLGALPAQVLSIMSIMKVGSSISIIMSATAVKLTLDGVTSDTFRKWIK
jgi:hypothetical protein